MLVFVYFLICVEELKRFIIIYSYSSISNLSHNLKFDLFK